MIACSGCQYRCRRRLLYCLHPTGPDMFRVGPLWKRRWECHNWVQRQRTPYHVHEEAAAVAAQAWERSGGEIK